MDALKTNIEQSLEELCKRMQAHFSALGMVDTQERTIRWQYGAGNRHERFKRIKQTIHEGIIGKTVQNKQSLILNNYHSKSGEDPRPYAILLAENLKSIIAVPLIEKEQTIGVLLIGCRHNRIFTEKDRKQVEKSLQNISNWLFS